MIDIILWVVAAVLFLGTAVRWIVVPIAVSWPAWLGFAIGAFAGANHSAGSLPVLLVSGLALAAAAHMANGYRLAVKYGLTGRRVSEEDAEVVTAFRAAGLDRSTGAVQRREAAKPLPRSAGVRQAGSSPVSQVSSSARRPVTLPVPQSDRGTLATSGAPRAITDKVAVSSRQAPTRVKPSSDPLHNVAGEPPSDAFVECWQAALQHLNNMVQDGIQTWLKGSPTPPFREHLSFRLGNQLFLIRIEDVSGQRGWVVVHAVRFPELSATVPFRWHEIAAGCASVSRNGFFASVAIGGGRELPGQRPDIRLLRGHKLYVRYDGPRIPTEAEIVAAKGR